MENEILKMLENKCSMGYIKKKTGSTRYNISRIARENKIKTEELGKTYINARRLASQGHNESEISNELKITIDYARYVIDVFIFQKQRTRGINKGRIYTKKKKGAIDVLRWVGPLPELTEEEKKQSETDYWEFHKDRNFTENFSTWEGTKKLC